MLVGRGAYSLCSDDSDDVEPDRCAVEEMSISEGEVGEALRLEREKAFEIAMIAGGAKGEGKTLFCSNG